MKFFKNFRIDKQSRDVIFDASVMGLHLVTHTLVGGAIGYGLDCWLDTKPKLFMVFLILGIIAGFRSVIQDSRKILRKLKEADSVTAGETETEEDGEPGHGQGERKPDDKHGSHD